jgi:hypothetical protein
VKNLSFDFMNETGQPVTIAVGSPLYSVEIDKDGDGITDDVASLTAFYCPDVEPEDTTWSRADFTGRTSVGCEIWLNSDGTNPAADSTGTKSAWAVLAAAHPTWKVVQAYLVVSEVGSVFLDRLAFQNEMFTAASTVVNCPSEASC